MASLRAGLRIVARMDTTPGGRDLTQMIRQVNRLVFESSASNRYATFFFAELDPRTRLLTFVNAGHNPPLLLRGSIMRLSAIPGANEVSSNC
jgi:phosphoserine phosphatase RsbU/P